MPGEKHIAPISENSLARMGTPVFSTWPTLGALLKGVLVDNSGDLCIRQVQAKKTGQSTEFTERTLTQGLIPGLGTEFRVPVVPAFIYGTYEAMPQGRFLRRLEQVTAVFGEPLDPGDLERRGEGEEARDRISHALHERVAELGERR